MLISGVYIIRNLKNRKVYVGSSINIKERWKKHHQDLQRGHHPNIHLQRAWDKDGVDSFEFKVLLYCNIEALIHCEQKVLDSYRWKNIYNILPIAGSCLGTKRSPETRAKMSKAQKGRKISSEHRAKISKTQTGRRLSPEHIAKMSKVMMGNQYAKGYKHTPEAKAKISRGNRVGTKGEP